MPLPGQIDAAVACNVNDPGAMKLLPGLVAVALLTLAGAGCSHGTITELPAGPSATPVIMTLTITPVGGAMMNIGGTAPITADGPLSDSGARLGAFAQYSDGSGKYVAAQWTTSDDHVIAIANGSFTATGRGSATITATAEGKTDSETFTVQLGIPGTWSGTYIVEQCGAGSGSMHEYICMPPTPGRTTGALYVGARAPLTLQITASGRDLTAFAQFGDFRGTLTGRDRGGNFLDFLGNLTSPSRGATVSLVAWDGRVTEDLMEGALHFEVRIAGVPSHAEVIARLDQVTRR